MSSTSTDRFGHSARVLASLISTTKICDLVIEIFAIFDSGLQDVAHLVATNAHACRVEASCISPRRVTDKFGW